MPQAILNSHKPSARIRHGWSAFCSTFFFTAARELLALASLLVGLGLGLMVLADGVSRLGAL